MKPYIMLNTMLITAGEKDFLKFQRDCFKLLNSKDGHPFLKGLFAVDVEKTEIKMYKPEYLEQAILDLRKTNV